MTSGLTFFVKCELTSHLKINTIVNALFGHTRYIFSRILAISKEGRYAEQLNETQLFVTLVKMVILNRLILNTVR